MNKYIYLLLICESPKENLSSDTLLQIFLMANGILCKSIKQLKDKKTFRVETSFNEKEALTRCGEGNPKSTIILKTKRRPSLFANDDDDETSSFHKSRNYSSRGRPLKPVKRFGNYEEGSLRTYDEDYESDEYDENDRGDDRAYERKVSNRDRIFEGGFWASTKKELEAQTGDCYICGVDLDEADTAYDHIISCADIFNSIGYLLTKADLNRLYNWTKNLAKTHAQCNSYKAQIDHTYDQRKIAIAERNKYSGCKKREELIKEWKNWVTKEITKRKSVLIDVISSWTPPDRFNDVIAAYER